MEPGNNGSPDSQTPATGNTSENNSGVETPFTTTTTSPVPSPATRTATDSSGSASPNRISTRVNPVEDVSPPFGISMVHGPPITLNLDLVPELTPSIENIPDSVTNSESAIHSHSAPRLPTSSLAINRGLSRTYIPNHTLSRYDDYYETTSPIHQREYDDEGSSVPSTIVLEKEVQKYIRLRDSAIYNYYPGTEREHYDYIAERTDMYTTNLYESTAHLIKGSLGAAVLSMHEAYMIGGLWTSLVVTVVVGVVIAHTMIMLIRSAQKMYRRLRINKLSYPDLAEAAAATAPWNWARNKSKVFRYTVEISLLLQMCGTCCIYQIVIATTMRQVLNSLHSGISEWLFDMRLYILISVPLLIPLCLIRSLKFLAPFAMIADIFVAICVFTTLYYCLLAFEVNLDERAAWKSTHGFIGVCGICMYGTSGICVALPVENNMKAPRYFPLIVRYATSIVVFLTATTGFFGYWAWGENCRSPITVHMPSNMFTTILQFLLVLMLSTTFAVNFWVPFRIVWHYIIKKHKRKLKHWERLYRFLMAILVMCISMLIPNIIPFMIFLGQFFMGFVALVFPAFIEFFVDWEEQYACRARVRFCHNAKNIGLVCLGLVLSASTVYSIRKQH